MEKIETRNLFSTLCATLTVPAPCISESYKIRITLNIYFHTSLRCLNRFYEGLKRLHKMF